MRNYFISLLILLFAAINFISCKNDPYKLKVSNENLAVSILRFDQDLIQVDLSSLEESRQLLYQKYGSFYDIYMEQIIQIGPGEDLNTLKRSETFTKDSVIQVVQDHIDDEFNAEEIKKVEEEFQTAFARYNTLFPNKIIPEIILSNTGFNVGIAILEKQIGIGLDFYIGTDKEVLKGLPMDQFPQFKRDKMDKEYMISDAVNYWVESELFPEINNGNLLTRIMEQGKLMYLMDVLFFDKEDRILMRYTEEEWEWAVDYQEDVWLKLGNQDILYGTKNFDIQKWINDGPFTNINGIPNTSPSRLGVWMGWQMINDYMEDHPEITFEELKNEKDVQKILKSYNPRS